MDFLKKIFFETKYLVKKIGLEKPIILMYHRVAEDKNDPHLLCVNKDNFRSHMEYLSKHKKIVPLGEILSGNANKKSVAITFDDGYRDNLTTALPVLKEFNAHATIFVSPGIVGQKFPWDEPDSSGICMSESEILELSKNNNIEIGAHTMNHPHLTQIPQESQDSEIRQSKKLLEKIVGKKIRYFAYPFGEYNEKSIGIVKDAGFEAAVAVRAESVDKNKNHYELPRFIVRNWDINKFARKIEIFK